MLIRMMHVHVLNVLLSIDIDVVVLHRGDEKRIEYPSSARTHRFIFRFGMSMVLLLTEDVAEERFEPV